MAISAEELVPQHERAAEIGVRLARLARVMPAVYFVGAEDVIQNAAAQIDVCVLQHHHRLRDRGNSKQHIDRHADEPQRQHACEAVDRMVQRMEAKVVEPVEPPAAVVQRVQPPQRRAAVMPAVRQILRQFDPQQCGDYLQHERRVERSDLPRRIEPAQQ